MHRQRRIVFKQASTFPIYSCTYNTPHILYFEKCFHIKYLQKKKKKKTSTERNETYSYSYTKRKRLTPNFFAFYAFYFLLLKLKCYFHNVSWEKKKTEISRKRERERENLFISQVCIFKQHNIFRSLIYLLIHSRVVKPTNNCSLTASQPARQPICLCFHPISFIQRIHI